MFKSLRAPERLFQLATWLVSITFAGFLIGLGGKVIGDLPGVGRTVEREQFIDARDRLRSKTSHDSLEQLARGLKVDRSRAQLAAERSVNAYQSKRETFDNWIATRQATTDPKQDPEVTQRTRELDGLEVERRRTQASVEALDARVLDVQQASEGLRLEQEALERAAEGPYRRAIFATELRVFGIRLLLTLPLLLLAVWLFARKRTSRYWPLARGFIVFALFAFFVELLPYLPSYGGYVRYVVGIVLTAVAGHYLIRAMQRYVAKRAEAAKQSEDQRRVALGYEEALKKMAAHLCPGCERPIVGGAAGTSNFCVHCGMRLFDACGGCQTRKNAFFQYCPACGVAAQLPSAEFDSAADAAAGGAFVHNPT